MSNEHVRLLKKELLSFIALKGAHVDFETAIKGLPSKYYGATTEGVPHSIWQLVEHIRLSQHDILEYIQNPHYVSPPWPEGYWPKAKAPSTKKDWTDSLKKFRVDYKNLTKILENPKTDLFDKIVEEKGKGPTLLHEILLIADHTSYHIGQIVLMRRVLGVWKD
jgi:uncharacterized damage-inducible protein DinB